MAAQDTCHEAFTIDKILENIMEHLNLCDRLGGAALVCQQFHVAGTHVTATEGVHQWFEGDDPEGEEAQHDKVVRWLNKHGHKVSCMVIHDGNFFRGDPQPFHVHVDQHHTPGVLLHGGQGGDMVMRGTVIEEPVPPLIPPHALGDLL